MCVYHKERKQGTGPTLGSATLDGRPPLGPICHLLAALHQVGAYLTDTLDIKQDNETPICITTTPWQQLRPQIDQLGKRGRFQQVSAERAFLDGQPELDHEVLTRAMAKRPPEELRILHYLMTGASWVAHHQHKLDQADTSRCHLRTRVPLVER